MKRKYFTSIITVYFMFVISVPFLILLIDIPSHIYGYSLFILFPIGLLVRAIMWKPSIPSAVLIAVRLRTPFVLFVLPTIFYFYITEVAGYILFGIMSVYLLTRFYSGSHQDTKYWSEHWKDIEKILVRDRNYEITFNKPLIIFMVFINILGIFLGNYFGGTTGIWIGIAVFFTAWAFSPYAREKIPKESRKLGNNERAIEHNE